MRTAFYVASTHWDREWYDSFQGYRVRLVSLLDELLATMAADPAYQSFVMDGQLIPILDYLEIRPERKEAVQELVRQSRLKLGPWYILPDEWLVSGESLIRNLQAGIAGAMEFGAPASHAGLVADQFGHVGQLPQIFDQLSLPVAFVWRGTHERESGGHFNWRAPDGTVIPTYRFGRMGYTGYADAVRACRQPDRRQTLDQTVEALVDYTMKEAARTPVGPILLFDGGDHMEIDPHASELLQRANQLLADRGIRIAHGDLDTYMAALLKERGKIDRTLTGELRESGRDPFATDEQWLIPGVLSSRIHLKQRNAACEDELCLWAEPFGAFAAAALGREYPAGYLRTAWRHLLENHPHDSICGCSIDQVHQDMIYRFDQSLGISSRMARGAMRAITAAAAPALPPDALLLGVFNATAQSIDEPVDLDVPLPTNWPTRFNEFFGYEEKFGFKLRGPDGEEVPYQLVGQTRDRVSFWRLRGKYPQRDYRHVVSISARVRVPAFGYTTLLIEPTAGPTRYLGSMATSHRCIENERLRVSVNPNGTIDLTDRQTGKTFSQLLTFEDRADIGDGWFHGLAVNDQIFNSTASAVEVALVADGIEKATLRLTLTMSLPAEFDFKAMRRTERSEPFKIVSDVTVRRGSDRVEIATTVLNSVCDHRLRVLLPTGLAGEAYLSDSAFDAVVRRIPLASDNNLRRELEVETRPQVTWTAFGDGRTGLAVVSRGLPECTVCDTADRPIALTLLRAFRRAAYSGENAGGQIQGSHTFRYDLVPFAGPPPLERLFLLGQRINGPVRVVDLKVADLSEQRPAATLPRQQSFLGVDGRAVVTSVQFLEGKLQIRMFNPHPAREKVAVHAAAPPMQPAQARATTLDGRDDPAVKVRQGETSVEVDIPPKRITTVTLAARG
ncbi:MAG: glycoside hydrolase family 38 [Opitutaceae bacterium]|nr:glycoside hydrolase family 38 [Opitutaceae bacterium]